MTPHQRLQEAFFAKDIREATRLLETFPFEEIISIIQQTNAKYIAKLLAHLRPAIAREVLNVLPHHLLTKAIPRLTVTEIANLLRPFPHNEQEKILNALPTSITEKVRSLLEYPTHSAGSIMDAVAPVLWGSMTAKEALTHIKEHSNDQSEVGFIVSRDMTFLGTVSIKDLVIADEDTQVSTICSSDIPSIQSSQDRELAVQLCQEHRCSLLAVVDSEKRLLGVIGPQTLSQDREKALTAPIHTMVGIPKNEIPQSALWPTIQKRLPWITLQFLIAALAVSVLYVYQPMLASNQSIVFFLPLLFIVPVSIGVQVQGLTVRGLYSGIFQSSAWYQWGMRELLITCLNGALCASLAIAMAYIVSQSVHVALALGIALWLAIILAGIVGTSLPPILAKDNAGKLQVSALTLAAMAHLVGLICYLALINVFLDL